MAGESIHNPVTVVNAVVFDPTGEKTLIAVRRKNKLEPRHLLTASSVTKGFAERIYRTLTGAAVELTESGLYVPTEATEPVPLGRGEHATSPDASALEFTLGKVGITDALNEGAVTAMAYYIGRSLRIVSDKDTEEDHLTDMSHWRVVLDSEEHVNAFPVRTSSYNPITWVAAKNVPDAYLNHDILRLNSEPLNNVMWCLGGACMEGAAYAVSPTQGSVSTPLRPLPL